MNIERPVSCFYSSAFFMLLYFVWISTEFMAMTPTRAFRILQTQYSTKTAVCKMLILLLNHAQRAQFTDSSLSVITLGNGLQMLNNRQVLRAHPLALAAGDAIRSLAEF